jgi:hypothetical protein
MKEVIEPCPLDLVTETETRQPERVSVLCPLDLVIEQLLSDLAHERCPLDLAIEQLLSDLANERCPLDLAIEQLLSDLDTLQRLQSAMLVPWWPRQNTYTFEL